MYCAAAPGVRTLAVVTRAIAAAASPCRQQTPLEPQLRKKESMDDRRGQLRAGDSVGNEGEEDRLRRGRGRRSTVVVRPETPQKSFR